MEKMVIRIPLIRFVTDKLHFYGLLSAGVD